jgi:hypothetical protein
MALFDSQVANLALQRAAAAPLRVPTPYCQKCAIMAEAFRLAAVAPEPFHFILVVHILTASLGLCLLPQGLDDNFRRIWHLAGFVVGLLDNKAWSIEIQWCTKG